jgi:hypothetical protein
LLTRRQPEFGLNCGAGVARTGDASIVKAAAKPMMLKETIVGPWVVEQSGNVDRKNVVLRNTGNTC